MKKRMLIMLLPVLALIGCEAKIETSVTSTSTDSSSSDSVSSDSGTLVEVSTPMEVGMDSSTAALQEGGESSSAVPDPNDLTAVDKQHATDICAAHGWTYDGYKGPDNGTDGDIEYTITCKPNGETNP